MEQVFDLRARDDDEWIRGLLRVKAINFQIAPTTVDHKTLTNLATRTRGLEALLLSLEAWSSEFGVWSLELRVGSWELEAWS